MPSLRSLLCAAVTALATAAPAAHAATITEYPLPTSGQEPTGIATAPDGHLWFAEENGAAFATATLDGTFTETGALRGSTNDTTVATNGDVWATEPGAGAIARRTAAGGLVQYVIKSPTSAAPQDIVQGPDGTMWFTQWTPDKLVNLTVDGHVTTNDANNKPLGITNGPDGRLWFTESGTPSAIAAFDPTTQQLTEYTTGLTPNSNPTSITTGPDGNLWFTESADPGAIGKITPQGAISEYTTGLTPNSDPSSITTGPDGYLWFTESADPGRIGRITPDGTITEYSTGLTAGSDPSSIVAGADGALWFTELADPGRLGRLALDAPAASTGASTDLTPTGATLSGTVDPNGESTTYHFEWGPTTAYGHSAPAVDAAVGADSADHAVTEPLTGLQPNTTYHYRLVAASAGGTADGADQSFTTSLDPPATTSTTTTTTATPTTPATTPSTTASTTSTTSTTSPPATTTTTTPTTPATTATVAPPPALPAVGHTAVAGVVSGTVLVKLPGSSRLVALGGGQTIPLGAVVDATHGVVQVTNALDRKGHTQSATVWAGSFSMTQARTGMTTFKVVGAPSCTRSAAGTLRADARARRAPVKLWSKDRHGHYSTRGRNSVATVRGTEWETIESCAGTRTVVRRGKVSVRDLRHRRTVLVKAGHSYLARR